MWLGLLEDEEENTDMEGNVWKDQNKLDNVAWSKDHTSADARETVQKPPDGF